MVNRFAFFELLSFCSVIATCDLVQDVEYIYGLRLTSGIFFFNMSETRAIARVSLIFQKRFPEAVSS